MTTIRLIHCQDSDMWLGYMENYLNYMTQLGRIVR